MLMNIKSAWKDWKDKEHSPWIFTGANITLLIVGFLFIYMGYKIPTNNAIYIGIVFLLLNNLVYAFAKLKERIVFLFFNLTLGLFTMSRPFFVFLEGRFDYLSRYYMEGMAFVLKALWLTLITLFIGAIIASFAFRNKKELPKSKNVLLEKIGVEKDTWVKNLRFVAEVVFYISYCCFLTLRVEEYLAVRGGTYLDYYTTFQSQFPYIVYIISSFMKYAFAIFLATLPSKRRAFTPLALYVISAIPTLLMGMRNPLAQNVIFVFMYYFIRDVLGDEKKWIGKIEKGLIIIGVPALLCIFGAYAYIRSNLEIEPKGIWNLMVSLLASQGVTFEVLHTGYAAIGKLPVREFRNYTFGGFIDYFTHGTIAQKLFGASPLPGGNNLTMALESNIFAHNMSYAAMGEEYLKGRGWGSSYLLETYVDYGYWGIAIFSIVLGIFMIYLMKRMGKGVLSTAFYLICLMSLFFVPRAAATGWLEFILTVQCWVSVFGIMIGTFILTKIREKYPNFLKITLGKKKGENNNA